MPQMTRPKMVKVVPEAKRGVAEIVHYTITDEDAKFGNLRAIIHHRRFELVTPGESCQLRVNGGLVMSDTDIEWRTNQEFMDVAHGKILVGGLGIGFILKAIIAKPEVESVTVIEKYQDVIDLVEPHIRHPRLKVVCGDVFEYRQQLNGDKFNVIYFDIWPGICGDNLDDMRVLERKYRACLLRDDPERWIGSWAKHEIKTFCR